MLCRVHNSVCFRISFVLHVWAVGVYTCSPLFTLSRAHQPGSEVVSQCCLLLPTIFFESKICISCSALLQLSQSVIRSVALTHKHPRRSPTHIRPIHTDYFCRFRFSFFGYPKILVSTVSSAFGMHVTCTHAETAVAVAAAAALLAAYTL